eukprot:325656-Pelagomonas_calceolata.AAC.1
MPSCNIDALIAASHEGKMAQNEGSTELHILPHKAMPQKLQFAVAERPVLLVLTRTHPHVSNEHINFKSAVRFNF